MIYHITSQLDWQQAQLKGSYQADTLSSQGFIHASTRQQVERTANVWYRGIAGLVLLEIDESKLVSEVKYEEDGKGARFPHIFGSLNLDAVVRVLPLPVRADGSFVVDIPTGSQSV